MMTANDKGKPGNACPDATKGTASAPPTVEAPRLRPEVDTAIALFRRFYLNRTDRVAFKPPWEGNVCPVEGNDNLNALLRSHLTGEPVAAHWMTKAGKAGDVKGPQRIGTYSPAPDNTTRILIVDFDGGGRHGNPLADPLAAALEFYFALRQLGIPAYLERSGSGTGWHVWVFFEPGASALLVRRLAFALVPADALLASGEPANARSNAGIEVFPMQDRIGKEKGALGNMVWLPWWHAAADGGNLFYRLDDEGAIAPFLPASFETVDEATLKPVLDALAGPTGKVWCLKFKSNRPATETLLQKYLARVQAGTSSGRNRTGFDLACQLRDNRYPYGVAAGVLLDYQRAVPQEPHPYTQEEALASLRSAYNSPAREPWGGSGDTDAGTPQPCSNGHRNAPPGQTAVPSSAKSGKSASPEWPPPVPLNETPEAAAFPITALPRALVPFVEEVAWSLNTPVDFVAVPLLGVAGGAIGNSRRVALHESHTQGAVLFVCVVGNPGSGKSPALEKVTAPLERAERRYYREWEQAVKEWAASNEDSGDGKDDRPKLRRVLLDDTTTEKMACLLGENRRRLVMVRDELTALMCGLNQYKNGKGHDRQIFLKLWSQATIRVDRKNHPNGLPITVYHPFCGILGTIQPDVVPRLRGESFRGVPPPDDGFLDRWLLSFPVELKAAGEGWRTVSQEATESWACTVDNLLDLQMVPDRDSELRPYLLQLDGDARAEWKKFTDGHARELNAEDFPSFLRGPWSKLRGYCGRLALVVHLLRIATGECRAGQVDGESVARATQLVHYFKSHARKVYAATDADKQVGEARRVLSCLARHHDQADFRGAFSRTAVYRRLRGYFKRPDALDAPLRLLVDHHFLRPVAPDHDRRPGHNPERYEINPLWDFWDAHSLHSSPDDSDEQG